MLTIQIKYISLILSSGIPIEVSYLADENGYQPTGPGIHPAILKAVAYQVAQARAENGERPGGIPIGGPGPYSPAPFPAYPSAPFVRPARAVIKASQWNCQHLLRVNKMYK